MPERSGVDSVESGTVHFARTFDRSANGTVPVNGGTENGTVPDVVLIEDEITFQDFAFEEQDQNPNRDSDQSQDPGQNQVSEPQMQTRSQVAESEKKTNGK